MCKLGRIETCPIVSDKWPGWLRPMLDRQSQLQTSQGQGKTRKKRSRTRRKKETELLRWSCLCHRTQHITGCLVMVWICLISASHFLPSSQSSSLFQKSSSYDLYSVQHMPGHRQRCSGVNVWTPLLLALFTPGGQTYHQCSCLPMILWHDMIVQAMRCCISNADPAFRRCSIEIDHETSISVAGDKT